MVGFRGDGLFAIFGLTPEGINARDMDQRAIVSTVCRCGQWMIEAVAQVVNPALEARGCRGDLRIGIGIDSGAVIITKIGFMFADEVTAYGDAVNEAAKIGEISDNDVCVSEAVDELFPTAEDGKVQFVRVLKHPTARRIVYPYALLT